MHAAVVTAFDTPPTYREFPTPTPQSPDEVLVDVIAAGVLPYTAEIFSGARHYPRQRC